MDPHNPFTEDQHTQMAVAISSGENALSALNKARAAGINVDAMQAQLEDALTRLRTIKQVYFPGR